MIISCLFVTEMHPLSDVNETRDNSKVTVTQLLLHCSRLRALIESKFLNSCRARPGRDSLSLEREREERERDSTDFLSLSIDSLSLER